MANLVGFNDSPTRTLKYARALFSRLKLVANPVPIKVRIKILLELSNPRLSHPD